MTIHKEGYPTILITIFLTFVLNYFVIKYFNDNDWIIFGAYALTGVLLIIVLQFFRAPKRRIVVNENHVLSPADGKVVVIEKVQENEFFKDERIQVSIFMSPKNVHINWNPISGLIKYVKYHPGAHYVAWHPKASHENEMTTIVVEADEKFQLLIRQIAGALARRIKYYVKEGEQVTQGEQLGFIKFGSRVDLLFPAGTKILVDLEEKVIGNRTVIARIKE